MEAVPAVSSSVERSSQNPLISLAPRLYTISHPNKCSKLENDEISGLGGKGVCDVIIYCPATYEDILFAIWHNLPSPSNDARHSQIMLLAAFAPCRFFCFGIAHIESHV